MHIFCSVDKITVTLTAPRKSRNYLLWYIYLRYCVWTWKIRSVYR